MRALTFDRAAPITCEIATSCLLDLPLIAIAAFGAFALRFDWLFLQHRPEFLPLLGRGSGPEARCLLLLRDVRPVLAIRAARRTCSRSPWRSPPRRSLMARLCRRRDAAELIAEVLPAGALHRLAADAGPRRRAADVGAGDRATPQSGAASATARGAMRRVLVAGAGRSRDAGRARDAEEPAAGPGAGRFPGRRRGSCDKRIHGVPCSARSRAARKSVESLPRRRGRRRDADGGGRGRPGVVEACGRPASSLGSCRACSSCSTGT